MRHLVQTRSQNQQAISEQRDADEKPYRDRTFRMHGPSPEQNIQHNKHDRDSAGPEHGPLIKSKFPFRGDFGFAVHQAFEFAGQLRSGE